MKKRVIAAIAVAAAGIVAAESIISNLPETAYAQEAFVGIDTVINSFDEDNPFTVVELVPDYNLAKIGFFFEGYEPYYYNSESKVNQNYLEHLATLSTAEERKAYMASLESGLSSIAKQYTSESALESSDASTGYALSYVKYKESYAYFSGAHVLNLTDAVTYEAGSTGLTMNQVGDGNGSYALLDGMTAVESGGNFEQNIVCYSKNPTEENSFYYNVTFSHVATEEIAGGYAYVVGNAVEIDHSSNDESWENVYYKDDNGIFVKANSTADGNGIYYLVTFTYVDVPELSKTSDDDTTDRAGSEADADSAQDGADDSIAQDGTADAGSTAEDGTAEDDETTGDKAAADGSVTENGAESETGTSDSTTGDISADEGNVSENGASSETENADGESADSSSDAMEDDGVDYYMVSGDVTFDASGKGSYGAVLSEDNPYVEAQNGHFTKEYSFVGNGKGNYDLKESTDGTLDGAVTVDTVYYTGAWKNNNLFMESVFNTNGTTDVSNIPVNVLVLTPSAYEEYTANGGSVSLLYISNSSAFADSSSSYETYGASNDLSDTTVSDLYKEIVSDKSRLPVIFDYSIAEDTSLSDTGIGTLAKLLSAQTLTEDNLVTTTDENGKQTSYVASDFAAFSDSNGDHFYVNDNVLVVPKDSSSFELLKDFSKAFLDGRSSSEEDFESSADALGFGDIARTITSENLYRNVENEGLGIEKYGLYEQVISKAIAAEFIISFSSKREEYDQTVFSVLDIEPCTITDSLDEIESKITNMLGTDVTETYDVQITHMTSAEYISKVEDIGTYDMVYLGLYTDTMNTDDNGRTVYNDSDMDGLVYVNIGDIKYDYAGLGILDTDYKNTSEHFTITNEDASAEIKDITSETVSYVRYSGNDLTDEKVTALTNYVKSGSPVILADDFLTYDSNGKLCVYDFDYSSEDTANGYIDNCSKMYSLIDSIKSRSNVLTESQVIGNASGQKILYRYLTVGKPVLTTYPGTDNNVDQSDDNDVVVETETQQRYYDVKNNQITFKFSIANFGAADTKASFNCYLYADYNSDGRYAASENISIDDYKVTLDGVKQEAIFDEETQTYYYQVTPTSSSEKFTLTYTLSDDFTGFLAVKLKVSQSSNPYRYDVDELYYSKKYSSEDELTTIKVIQIVPYTTGNNGSLIIGKKMYDEDTITGIAEDSYFYKLLLEMKNYGYDLDIVAISDELYAKKYAENPAFLDDYNMLILGISDMADFMKECHDTTVKSSTVIAAAQGILDFIDSGKSVLITHDTTCYTTNKTGDYFSNGSSFTLSQLLCGKVGLNRYGVYTSDLLRSGIETLTKYDTKEYSISDYYSLKQAQEKGLISSLSDTITGGELFESIVEEAKENNKDIAYKPNSNKTELVSEVQGLSTVAINSTGLSTDYEQYYSVPSDYLNTADTRTSTAELLNTGQILVYPYDILTEIEANDNKLSIAYTHNQYYQIDMNEDDDEDGESDITVWLTLATSSWNGSAYKAATREARNNYYIYTKGNVTYSGIGEYGQNSNSQWQYPTEQKLYVNTIIASINSGLRSPKVNLKKTAASDADDLSVIYVGMDSLVEDGVVIDGEQIDKADETESIYFTVSDTNVVSGTKKIGVDYYLVFDSESDVPTGLKDKAEKLKVTGSSKEVWAVQMDFGTYTGEGDDKVKLSETSNLTAGVTYSCEVPYNILDMLKEDEDDVVSEADIWVVVTTKIWGQNVDTSKDPSGTYSGYSPIKIQRIGLFDLD